MLAPSKSLPQRKYPGGITRQPWGHCSPALSLLYGIQGPPSFCVYKVSSPWASFPSLFPISSFSFRFGGKGSIYFYVLDSKLKLEGDSLIMIILGLFGMCFCPIQPCDSLSGFLPSFWFLPFPPQRLTLLPTCGSLMKFRSSGWAVFLAEPSYLPFSSFLETGSLTEPGVYQLGLPG